MGHGNACNEDLCRFSRPAISARRLYYNTRFLEASNWSVCCSSARHPRLQPAARLASEFHHHHHHSSPQRTSQLSARLSRVGQCPRKRLEAVGLAIPSPPCRSRLGLSLYFGVRHGKPQAERWRRWAAHSQNHKLWVCDQHRPHLIHS